MSRTLVPGAPRRISRRTCLALGAAGGVLGLAAAVGVELAPASPQPAQLLRAAQLPDEVATPLLVVLGASPAAPLSGYLAEILAAEGMLAYRTVTPDMLTPALLRSPVLLLGEQPLSAEQRTLIAQYVAGGGALIAMRPDPRLAEILGVAFPGGERAGGLLALGDHPAAAGLARQLRYHGPATQLELRGAEAIAWEAGEPSRPLIGVHRYGQGTAVFWAFDLARSVALTRQGNPDAADQDRDSIPGVRAADLFVDWVDLDRMSVPHADELQRLLVALLQHVAPMPLPRLWYLPGEVPAALILTGDAHGSHVPAIEGALQRVERAGGTMSVYYTPPVNGALRRIPRKLRWWLGDLPMVGDLFEPQLPHPSPTHVERWRAAGHEFGMHPYVEQGLHEGYETYWTEFVKLGYGADIPTVRTHRVLWHGWVENARAQAAFGTRMNLDSYHLGSAVRYPDGSPAFGFMTGSGLPMRFIDRQGAVLPVFQQHTHLVDEDLFDVFGTGYDLGLSPQAATEVVRGLLDLSLRGAPAAIGMQCHIDSFVLGGELAERAGAWLDGSLAAAAERGAPIMSAERWLRFSEARRQTRLEALSWLEPQAQLEWRVVVPPEAGTDLRLLVPAQHRGLSLREVRIDAMPAQLARRTLAGRQYASVQLASGRHSVQMFY